MNNYCIVDRSTTEVVQRGLNSRQDARIAKRELEYKHSAANDHRPMPTRYSVETDVDHKDGAGIYKH